MSVFELWVFFVVLPFIKEIGVTFFVLSMIGFMTLIFFRIMLFGDSDFSKYKKEFKTAAKTFAVLLFVGFIGSLAPNDRQVALIVGGSVVTNVEGIDKLPENIVNAANNYLKAIEQKD